MHLMSLLGAKARAAVAKDRKNKNSWERKKILMTVTGFESVHTWGGSGINREPALVELMTTHHELADVHAIKDGNSWSLYVRYEHYMAAQGLGGGEHRHASYLIVVRKGFRTHVVTFAPGRNADNHGFKQLFPSDKRDWLNNDPSYDIKDLAREIEYRDEEYLTTHNRAFKALRDAGYKVLKVMEYHERLWIYNPYVRAVGSAVEFGWEAKSTYQSFPRTLRIDFLGEVKTVDARKAGVQTPSMHNDRVGIARHTLRADQVEEAKAFSARFRRNRAASEPKRKAGAA